MKFLLWKFRWLVIQIQTNFYYFFLRSLLVLLYVYLLHIFTMCIFTNFHWSLLYVYVLSLIARTRALLNFGGSFSSLKTLLIFKKNVSKLSFYRMIVEYSLVYTLREKCPNTEFFLVRSFPHLHWIHERSFFYFLAQISFFGGTVLGRFIQCNFEIFLRWPTMVAYIFATPTQ